MQVNDFKEWSPPCRTNANNTENLLKLIKKLTLNLCYVDSLYYDTHKINAHVKQRSLTLKRETQSELPLTVIVIFE